ncbi:two-component sensor histidine kinase [Paramagnetospirillum kuznetsovii]|uniref:histidine kinase n=2 Tax=Paramagnetospirillum kuznetsovii TaxID=2053833 RepID=A0A364P0Y8_9PROT|nr:two-component sensor histidine kinase [Paramagnetospirillum kuznetsovii]
MALMIGGLIGGLYHLRNVALDGAVASTQGVARLLDEHLGRTLATTDAILYRGAKIATARAKGEISTDEELREFQQLVTSLPERGAILATDADGNVIVSTSAPDSSNVNIAFREWFQDLAAGEQVVVGPMFRNRFNNRLIFTLSRRISDDLGNFAGMISVGIDVSVFTDYHRSLVIGHNGFVAATTKGNLILRQPEPEAFVDRSLVGGKLAQAAASEPNGTLRFTSDLDGIDRIVSYRTLAGFNVEVSAGLAVDDVLAPWRKTALLLGSAMAVVALGLLGVASMAFRAIQREEAISSGLERTVHERTMESEQRALEARLANDSKTRFLAAASHDLRQPLQAAGMFTEVLAANVTTPMQTKVIDKLRQSIEATNSLLTSLLDVSTFEAGKIKPKLTSFRIMPLLNGLVDQVEPEASRKGLSIGAIPSSSVVTSDAVLLERLLRNLLVNAVRYTERGGIRVGCRHRGAKVAIQIWDTGVGIPADKIGTIFDDFTRLDVTQDRGASKGLGLGLGVVRRMASVLGHKLEVKSVPGKGSCFTVIVAKG